ncbi:MAG: DUF3037 domain-containing protein [Dehalococcoidia bacterium]|nr:DUF3037 domain-containing protein [Dehalococcoidia bacterium]
MSTGTYHLVRFAPDPVRDEPLNIGLVMAGDFSPRVAFPEAALQRAARWCRTLDSKGLVALRDYLQEALERAAATAADIGEAIRPDFMGERFGPVSVSESRWIDLPDDEVDLQATFEFLLGRLVLPPKQVAYGGGGSAGEKLAKAVLPAIKSAFPRAHLNEPLVGRSGRPFVADVFASGNRPLILSTIVPSSSWQGIRLVEAKAFEMFDVGRTMKSASLAICGQFPSIDPEGVQEQARAIFDSIEVSMVTPERIRALVDELAVSAARD